MVLPGLTLTVEVVALPALALQVYELAPLAVSTVLCPVQIDAGLAFIETVGVVLTLTEIVCVAVQVPLAPVTVYVVATPGETETVDVVALPALALQV